MLKSEVIMKDARLVVISLILIGIALFAPDFSSEKERILVDNSHSEIFFPFDEGDRGYSKFLDFYRANGYKIEVNNYEISENVLKTSKIFILFGPMSFLKPEEIKALKSYVAEGNKVIILIHLHHPLQGLLNDFLEIKGVVLEKENIISMPQDFFATDFENHMLTENITKLAFFGAFALLPKNNTLPLVYTSDEAWIDVNRNLALDNDEIHGKLPLVCLVKYGKGEFLVIGDDAPLINRFIDIGDNKIFAKNVVKWSVSSG